MSFFAATCLSAEPATKEILSQSEKDRLNQAIRFRAWVEIMFKDLPFDFKQIAVEAYIKGYDKGFEQEC